MYGFKAIKFEGKRTARKALDTLEDYTPAYAWIDDVAVVSRNGLGAVSIHSTWSEDGAMASDAGWGLVTGGVVGLLFGPAGALAGAAIGGSWGAWIGALEEVDLDDPVLADFANSLAKDSSALILVGENATLADFDSAVEPFRGEIVSTDLDENDVQAIRKALQAKA